MTDWPGQAQNQEFIITYYHLLFQETEIVRNVLTMGVTIIFCVLRTIWEDAIVVRYVIAALKQNTIRLIKVTFKKRKCLNLPRLKKRTVTCI